MVQVIATREDLLEGIGWPENEHVATCAWMEGARRSGTLELRLSHVKEYLKHVNETRARMESIQ